MKVSVLLPCRNEEETVGKCIDEIHRALKGEDYEIIVSDSSSDRSPRIAASRKALVVKHDKIGYGVAIAEGLKYVSGEYVVIGDCDGTYDFSEIHKLLDKLDEGYDYVSGNRLRGKIEKGAMPFLHRHIGNPLLSSVMNLCFRTGIGDTQSGFKAFRRRALDRINMKTSGMEFASEMLIRAAKGKISITEVPVSYRRRGGTSKLKSLSDGWRTMRFMLMFSPTILFLLPGVVMLALGLSVLAFLAFGTLMIGGADRGMEIGIAAAALSVLGFQIINIGLYSRIYAIHSGFVREDRLISWIARAFTLERGTISGLVIIAAGLSWIILNRGLPVQAYLISLASFIIGIQAIFSVFFISMMLIEKNI